MLGFLVITSATSVGLINFPFLDGNKRYSWRDVLKRKGFPGGGGCLLHQESHIHVSQGFTELLKYT